MSITSVSTMALALPCLNYAGTVFARIGHKGIDAATGIIGFFVACVGTASIFRGLSEALTADGILPPGSGLNHRPGLTGRGTGDPRARPVGEFLVAIPGSLTTALWHPFLAAVEVPDRPRCR